MDVETFEQIIMAADLSSYTTSTTWTSLFHERFIDSFVSFLVELAIEAVSIEDVKARMIAKKLSVMDVLCDEVLALVALQLIGNYDKWKTYHDNRHDPYHECHKQKNQPGRFGKRAEPGEENDEDAAFSGPADKDDVFKGAVRFFRLLRKHPDYEIVQEKAKEAFKKTSKYKEHAPSVLNKGEKKKGGAVKAPKKARYSGPIPTYEHIGRMIWGDVPSPGPLAQGGMGGDDECNDMGGENDGWDDSREMAGETDAMLEPDM